MDALINLEYSIEQQCWHYNFGNDPKRLEWFTVAEQEPLSKIRAFCDIVDTEMIDVLKTKKDFVSLFKVFNAGYNAALPKNE